MIDLKTVTERMKKLSRNDRPTASDVANSMRCVVGLRDIFSAELCRIEAAKQQLAIVSKAVGIEMKESMARVDAILAKAKTTTKFCDAVAAMDRVRRELASS